MTAGLQYEMRSVSPQDTHNIHNGPYIQQLQEAWSEYLNVIPAHPERNINNDVRKSTAMVLESTYANLQRDSRGANLNESATHTSAIDDYAQTIFPVLMRVFPNLIAHDLVSIQPMSGPIGAVFYFEYKHATQKGSTQKGDNLIEKFNHNYSSEYVDGELLQIGNGTDFGGAGATLDGTLKFTPVFSNGARPDSNYKVIIKEETPSGAVVQQAEDDGQGGFTFIGGGGSGNIEYKTGSITGFGFANAVAQNNTIKAYYAYSMEGNTQSPRVTLDIALQTIQAKTRRLNATWSAEAADDLRALHGIEGESQLLIGLANEIGLEIDREILQDLIDGAESNDTWDRTVPSGTHELDHIRSFLTVLTTQANVIHSKSKRLPANWITTSPEIAALFAQFQSNGDFLPAAPTQERPESYGVSTSDFGVFRFGTLSRRFKVYQDPFINKSTVLMGLKGQSYLDAGYVYAPYVPLAMTPTFLDPGDNQYKKGLRTRYAKKLLRGSFYSTIDVLNL